MESGRWAPARLYDGKNMSRRGEVPQSWVRRFAFLRWTTPGMGIAFTGGAQGGPIAWIRIDAELERKKRRNMSPEFQEHFVDREASPHVGTPHGLPR